MSIGVANGTTIPINLVVNGSLIVTVPPLTDEQIAASALTGLPWQVEAQTAAGRTLVTLIVNSGSVYDSGSQQGGPARRVDLSCGRLDIWSGPPLAGPMPGPGIPGDCD